MHFKIYRKRKSRNKKNNIRIEWESNYNANKALGSE
jgi:hypothetical protein